MTARRGRRAWGAPAAVAAYLAAAAAVIPGRLPPTLGAAVGPPLFYAALLFPIGLAVALVRQLGQLRRPSPASNEALQPTSASKLGGGARRESI